MEGSFSFNTPEEVMHVLASVRSSGISSEQKNSLRDLILSYTNGGKDPSLKIQIEQQLSQLGITPVEKKTSLSNERTYEFGSARTVPTFSVSPPVTTPKLETPTNPAPANVESRNPQQSPAPTQRQSVDVDHIPPPAPSQKSEPPHQTAPQEVQAFSAPTPNNLPQQNPVSRAIPHVQNEQQTQPRSTETVQLTPQSTASAEPHAPTEAAAVPAPAPAPVGGQDPLNRIREIKSQVNERIGNPVNLVDINNAVGREYMSALLDAMKNLSSGADVSTEMRRLEEAFAAVNQILDTYEEAGESESQPASQTVPAAASPASSPTQPPSPPRERKRSSVPQVSNGGQQVSGKDGRWENDGIRVPENIDLSIPVEPPSAAPESDSQTNDNNAKTPPVVAPKRTPVTPPQPLTSAPIPSPAAVVPEVAIQPEKPQTAAPTATDTQRLKPVSDSGEPYHSVDELPSADSISTSSQDGNPLFTKEVDNGLQQLLSDWVLFKKSGLLGRGPNGVEHPLYLKLKDLQIPMLLAGRFEGATQEVKQSITDYMNGWRYEQGIIYEQGETFEHYLRRVIRHIIDLQK